MSPTPDPPSDFEAFWRETASEALEAPLDFERNRGNAFDFAGFLIETYTFRGIIGEARHGWIAVPCHPERSRRISVDSPDLGSDHRNSAFGGDTDAARMAAHPVTPAASGSAFLWIPPYGRESLLPNQYGTREGFVSGSLNFFGHDAFHQEKYQPSRGYFTEGVLEPRTWVMRRMFQDAVLAARVIREQPEVDRDRFGVMGMSQGGGFAIWLGAWIEWVRAVCADMPFLGGVSQTLGAHVYRYPLKELIDLSETSEGGLDRIRETIRHFDTLNQAVFCAKPTHVSLGEKDPAVKPASVEAVFGVLPGEKVLRRYPVGHDWFPDMVENNRAWLVEHL